MTKKIIIELRSPADILLMMLIIEKHFITAYQKTFKIRFDLVTIPMIKGEEVLII